MPRAPVSFAQFRSKAFGALWPLHLLLNTMPRGKITVLFSRVDRGATITLMLMLMLTMPSGISYYRVTIRHILHCNSKNATDIPLPGLSQITMQHLLQHPTSCIPKSRISGCHHTPYPRQVPYKWCVAATGTKPAPFSCNFHRTLQSCWVITL